MSRRLRQGKVPWDLVAEVVARELPPEVVLGPAAGEDAALVTLGGELWAVATDPVSFTAHDAGRLAVTVNANDVAVRGARPSLFLAVLLVAPDEAEEDRIRELLGQVVTACDRLGVALIGGHTEVTPGLAHSVVVGTMLGRVAGRPITTGGLCDGDFVGITRWAGLEGTAILLGEYGQRLRSLHGETAFRELDAVLAGDWLSVVPEALAAAADPAVSALHDVTEGGVGEALWELQRASGLTLEVALDRVPVRPETRLIARDLGLDPLGLIGSGALLVGCAGEGRERVAAALQAVGVGIEWIGHARARVEPAPPPLPRFERDELLRAFAGRGTAAVVFDMDGTLIDSDYDWPAIRRRLGVGGRSIIDDLNGLPAGERARRWAELEAIEERATGAARLKDGVPELLALLAVRHLPTALVTNNSERNARELLDRYGLRFDVVLTRDSGLWKPSGAPLAEAVRRLGAPPERCLAVGDSRYDLEAAREAGCGAVCLLYQGAERHRELADLALAGVPELTRYLDIVLEPAGDDPVGVGRAGREVLG
jgi:hydrogenase expression/formation protein HypE